MVPALTQTLELSGNIRKERRPRGTAMTSIERDVLKNRIQQGIAKRQKKTTVPSYLLSHSRLYSVTHSGELIPANRYL